MKKLIVTSSAFQNNGFIPSEYTCDGEDINPPLKIEDIPKEAQGLSFIVDDPDAPMGTWDHWTELMLWSQQAWPLQKRLKRLSQ